MSKYTKFIGRTFTVKGFNEPRQVKINRVYRLCGSKQYPTFSCEITKVSREIGSIRTGERENFLCKDVVKNGKLLPVVKVLSA